MAAKKKLQKLTTDNIYDTIGQNAPVQTVAVPDQEEKTVIVKEGSKPVEAGLDIDLLNPEVKERKSASMYLRCKPSVKKKFDAFCDAKGISQADMFEFWVESLLK